ncbi:MAG: hypothetical protein GY851_06880 [bacterium]|nr:hypothetical protein [bacterium]
MRTRSLLVHFPGYPFDIETFQPDHQLASVAGCLIEAGHEARIHDFATPDYMERLFPDEARDTAVRVADYLYGGKPPSPMTTLQLLWQIRVAHRAYERRRAEVCGKVAERLATDLPADLVVFSLATLEDYDSATRIARRLKARRPDAVLAVLGAFVDVFATDILAHTELFDCACLADAECGIVDLASSVHDRTAWGRVPNLAFRDNGGITVTERRMVVNLGAFPSPDYTVDTYPALKGDGKLKLFTVEDSRGAWGASNALPTSGTGHEDAPRHRVKPVSNVCDEVGHMMAHHGAQVFRMSGPATPPEHVASVASALMTHGLRVVYSRTGHMGFGSPGQDPQALMRHLADSGCIAMDFDVATGSQRLLEDHYGRDTCVTEIETVLRASRKAGMFTGVRLTYPCPDDDYHTRAETVRMLLRTKPHAACVSLPDVLPGSTWYHRALLHGYGINAKHHFARALRCGAQFPLPRDRWRTTPFTIGRLSAGQIISSQEDLIRDIEERGISAQYSSALPLLACMTGHARTPRALVHDLRMQLVTGDVAAVADWVTRFNEAACVPDAARGGFRQYDSMRQVVGN